MNVSVIVPVYNVEKYLSKCLDSLVSQTLQNIEIIVVNDGSPDQSQAIIDTYCEKYNYVKSFIKENGGLSDARNFGLQKATGEYVAFVDSDDYVDCSMYKEMYEKAKENDFDIVVCDFEELYEDHIVSGTSRIKEDILNKAQVKMAMCDIYPSAWNKLYKRTLFTHLQFKKNVWFEDVELLYRLLPSVNSIGVVHRPFYKYMQRAGSISKSVDMRIYHCVENWDGIVQYYQENHFYDNYYKELEYNYVRYLYATFVKAAWKFDKENYQKAVTLAMQRVKTQFPTYRRNSYFYKSAKGLYLVVFNHLLASILYKLKHKTI